MNTQRRRLAVAVIALSGLAALSPAQAWDWTFGSGERVKGSGEAASEKRSPGSFDAITLSGEFKVLVRQAATESVEIRADKNLLPLIETQLVGSTLEVRTKKGYRLSGTMPIQVNVDIGALRALAVNGSGDIRVETMKTPQLDASISGSGDVRFAELFSERVGFKVSGSGDILAKGRINSLAVSVAGSGDVKASELVADEVKVSIAGSGDVQVQANKQLKVSIAGSGDVRYLGSPEISSSVAGSGSIKRLGN
ncbi:head GIN domain-containing protein [Roseateles cavernae]|uniref:head GIN domain-containing protein n=1 Tax=Roseateles cavernae TaxID=3153578 RepID=UPI0032E46475